MVNVKELRWAAEQGIATPRELALLGKRRDQAHRR